MFRKQFNPFTRFLAHNVTAVDLQQFLSDWDALEALLIAIYKAKTTAHAAELAELCERLRAAYPNWQAALRPFWQGTQVAGKLCETDPFAHILAQASSADWPQHWQLLQTLPAAREALNRFLQSRAA
jgi:hypothetical protein